MSCFIVPFLQQVDQAMLIAGHLSAKDVSNLRATCRDLRVTALQMTPELRLPLVPMDLAHKNQVARVLSSMTNSRQWTLRLVSTSTTESTQGHQIQFRLHAHQQLEQHQRPTLTAHSIYFDFTDKSNWDAVRAMTYMLDGIMYPHLRQMEVRVGALTEQRTTDSQWLMFGQSMATLEERSSIHTLRLHGMALPNPGLCNVLGHLPNVQTLSLPWRHVNRHNYASCLAPLTMLRSVTHVEGYEEGGIVGFFAHTLQSLRMPSVQHVSTVSDACKHGRLMMLFPGVRHINGTVSLDFPLPRLPDCTALRINVARLQELEEEGEPKQLQLPAGSLPSLDSCAVLANLDDTPGRMVYIRNLLRQVLAAAPNLRSVTLGRDGAGAGLSKLTPVRSLLLALAGERPVNITMKLNLSMDEYKRCRRELNRALKSTGINFPPSTDTSAASLFITAWRGCSIQLAVTIWESLA